MSPLGDRFRGVRRLFMDTAPIIYYVERNSRYFPLVCTIFDWINEGRFLAVTSPITLTECLVQPYRLQITDLQQDFFDLITGGQNTVFSVLDQEVARHAAQLRAQYGLFLADAIQVATALANECEAFLTNDVRLGRLKELEMIVLSDLSI